MIRSCDKCGVVAFNDETGTCEYCVAVAKSEAQRAGAEEVARKKALESDPALADLLKGSVGNIVEDLESISDSVRLDELATAEGVGKARKGVLDAIVARKKALESGAEE